MVDRVVFFRNVVAYIHCRTEATLLTHSPQTLALSGQLIYKMTTDQWASIDQIGK